MAEFAHPEFPVQWISIETLIEFAKMLVENAELNGGPGNAITYREGIRDLLVKAAGLPESEAEKIDALLKPGMTVDEFIMGLAMGGYPFAEDENGR